MFNRRVHVRVHPKPGEPIEVQVTGDDFIDEFDVRDISTGGLALAAQHMDGAWTPAAQIELMIKLPRQRAFVARGVIRHLSAHGVLGIEFTELAPADLARLELYVEKRRAEGGAAG
jgi:hypothetical protein